MSVIISIIIPTFNRAGVIGAAIKSVREQTFQDWECIIVDDHSTDDTKHVIDAITREAPRFSYLPNARKKGAPGARNTGLLAAVGEYVVFFDSDNTMHPEFLERVYAAIQQKHVEVGSCFSSIIDIESGKRVDAFRWIGNGEVHGAIMRGKCYFDNSSTIIKRQKLLDMGMLDEDCPSYQEWDTHIRLSRIARYITVTEELVDYYRGGEDTISKSLKRSAAGQLFILEKNRTEYTKRYPLAYLKYCFFLYCRIRKLPIGEDSASLLASYHRTVSGLTRLLVRMLYPLRRIIE